MKKHSRKQKDENLKLLDIQIQENLNQSALLGFKKFDLAEFARDCNIVIEASNYTPAPNINILFTTKAYENFKKVVGGFHIDDNEIAGGFVSHFLYEIGILVNKITNGKNLEDWFYSDELKKIGNKYNLNGLGFDIMQVFFKLNGNSVEIIHLIDSEETLYYEYPDYSNSADKLVKNQAKPVSVKIDISGEVFEKQTLGVSFLFQVIVVIFTVGLLYLYDSNKQGTNKKEELLIPTSIITQIEKCWNAPASLDNSANIQVLIDVDITKSGVMKFVGFTKPNNLSSDSDMEYNALAESARQAIVNPNCNPLRQIPPLDKYDLWKELTVAFKIPN